MRNRRVTEAQARQDREREQERLARGEERQRKQAFDEATGRQGTFPLFVRTKLGRTLRCVRIGTFEYGYTIPYGGSEVYSERLTVYQCDNGRFFMSSHKPTDPVNTVEMRGGKSGFIKRRELRKEVGAGRVTLDV